METWYKEVAEGETIICLRDVTVDGEAPAHHQEWWRQALGAKWLVLGNHDVDPVNREHHRAASRGHGHHVVDPPPAAPIGTRQSRCEAGRLGDTVAVVELPAAPARTDRASAESEDGLLHDVPSFPNG